MGSLEYTLIRSKRKTVSLQITGDLRVVVRCPNAMAKAAVDRFVDRHRGWIEKHMPRLEQRAAEREAFRFEQGQEIPYLGERYAVRLEPGRGPAELREGACLLPGGDEAARERALISFYKEKAREIMPGLVAKWSGIMGATPEKITVTSAKTRWGSCSGKGVVCFSWRVIMLPPELAEYIVVHELAHLTHRNHSAAFHALVHRHLPDEGARRRGLREFGRRLIL